MGSRGVWTFMSARTRRSLTLTWTALFVLSLLLQYARSRRRRPCWPSTTRACSSSTATRSTTRPRATTGPNIAARATASRLVTDRLEAHGTTTSRAAARRTLNTSRGAGRRPRRARQGRHPGRVRGVYEKGGDTIVYFGVDRFANNGDAQVGFWFFQNGISATRTAGSRRPAHGRRPASSSADFTNGGAVAEINLYEWVGSGGQQWHARPAGDRHVRTAHRRSGQGLRDRQQRPTTAPWPYTPKAGHPERLPAGQRSSRAASTSTQLFGGDAPCFSALPRRDPLVGGDRRPAEGLRARRLQHLRSAHDRRRPRRPRPSTSAARSPTPRRSSGTDGPASGTVTFFICTPAQVTAAGCPEGTGTQVGAPSRSRRARTAARPHRRTTRSA